MPRRLALVAALVFAVALVALSGGAQAQSGEVASINASYTIEQSGLVQVREDITYDFGTSEHHGIFRYTPVRYSYNDQQDRKIDLTDIAVTDGNGIVPQPFEITDTDPNLVIKIGDPDVLLTGKHAYEITYTLNGALNPFSDHDEFFWNVTGNDWQAPIAVASVVVTVLAGSSPIERVDCFQGEAGSTDACQQSSFQNSPPVQFDNPPQAVFTSRGTLLPGEGMTIVIGLQKGAVNVGPPLLVNKIHNKNVGDYFLITPITVGVMLIGILAVLVAIARLWWVQGRDRWLGNMFYMNETPSAPGAETVKPLMAHETIVVEFTPPELDGMQKRRLRPAEIGVLLDERADTLDVSATIVDLAVRKHMTIAEEKEGGVFGLLQHKDYELTKLTPDAGDLLPYESQLKDALFDTGDIVKLSDLKNKFHDDLAKVKCSLYEQGVEDKFFPVNPETVRHLFSGAGVAVGLLGGGAVYGLGRLFGGGLIGAPLIVAGVILIFTANAFPRRTGTGRVLYRRSLGFRRFMVESDAPREKFAENANIFHDYLPYAIVFGCVDRWAKVFKDLGIDPGPPTYYIGTGAFVAASFADSMTSFSSSISSTMASTPGGSGGSGFGGGGGSGGGGGGGGGGAW